MLYIALLHYPVYNKSGKIVTTAIANMDIHDIARVAKTYGVEGFYIVNPIEDQRNLAQEIVGHWRGGYGASYNTFRKASFELIQIAGNLQSVIEDITKKTGSKPETVVTGANLAGDVITFAALKKILQNNDVPYLLVFGTGSGIAAEVINTADYRLEPIKGASGYNHLSVRSAVAIVLDRILGI
jgi:hypothetical protein